VLRPTHASIVFGGMLALVNSVNSVKKDYDVLPMHDCPKGAWPESRDPLKLSQIGDNTL